MTNHANDDRDYQCINCEKRCGKSQFHCSDCADWMEEKWRIDQKTRWFNVIRNARGKFFGYDIHGKFFNDDWPDGWPERLTRKTKFLGPLDDQGAPKGP